MVHNLISYLVKMVDTFNGEEITPLFSFCVVAALVFSYNSQPSKLALLQILFFFYEKEDGEGKIIVVDDTCASLGTTQNSEIGWDH